MSAVKRHNVRVSGKGKKTIMFSHGYGCDQNMWRLVAPAFEEEFKVILFDHIGAGGADAAAYNSLRYNSLQAYADDVLAIINELGLNDIVFVGHSVSSMIGVLAEIQQPDKFSHLVLVGPSPRYINDQDYIGGFEKSDIEGLLESLESNYLGWSSAMAPSIMGNPDRPELGEELTNSFCQMDPEIAKNFAKITFLSDNRKDISQVKAKTLVMQCSNDIIAPTEVGQFVHEKITNSQLVVMNATGHCPNLSAPEETIDLIKSFLSDDMTH